MATQRSKKSRSLGIDPPSAIQSSITTSVNTTSRTKSTSLERPKLGDRLHSEPIVAQQKSTATNQASANNRPSDRTNRNSKASSHGSGTILDSSKSDGQNRSQRSSKRSSNDDVPVLNFAVLGNEGVGKTGFIRNALDLHKHKTISPISTSKVSLGGKIYRIQLIELLLEDVDCGLDKSINWPKSVSNASFPKIDGTFCLFDVSQKSSIAGLHPVLSGLSTLSIPNALISCKIDVPDVDQEGVLAFTERVHKTFPHLIVGQVTITSPETAKRCLLRLLKALLFESDPKTTASFEKSSTGPHNISAVRAEPLSRSPSTSRSRSNSDTDDQQHKFSDQPNAFPVERKHSNVTDSTGLKLSNPSPLKLDTKHFVRPDGHNTDPQTPISTTEPSGPQLAISTGRHGLRVPETPESYKKQTVVRPGTAETDESRKHHTFLDMDDDSIDSNTSDSETGPNESLEEPNPQDSLSEGGISFTDLVSRLLSLPTTRSDEKFIPSFLCLYRCFATPHRLLTEIADQFVKVENDNGIVPFAKVAEQLRYLSILSLWTEDYPGDFAAPIVRDIMLTFVRSIERSKHFGPAAKEINNNLLVYFIDEDEDWAYTDKPSSRSRSNTLAKKSSNDLKLTKVLSKGLQGTASDNDDSDDDVTRTTSSPRHSGAPSSVSSLMKPGTPPTKSATNQAVLERARENASRLRCVPHLRITKVQWHLFMDSPIDDIAREIIRIDWIGYSAIRPRDFVRQAISTGIQKAKRPQNDAIATMTRKFNHLTFFVSGMILLRDKPKHRAKILEKFMHLAWKVRQQNDYQSLGAIVAALKGEEIVRLSQTHELIPQDTLKQFWRLKILMDHQRSHSAYRMAWENSFSERIPFLPRIQEDLTKAAAGNPTFIGQNIKWSKFEVMGETIIGLQRSRETPYTFLERTQRSQELTRLILETKVLDGPEDSDDPKHELYERSKQIEPQTATDGKKKFEWLRR